MTRLGPVDGLGKRDVCLVAEGVVGLEVQVVIGAVFELDPQEVMVLRRGYAEQLESEGKNIVGGMKSHLSIRVSTVCRHVDLRTLGSLELCLVSLNMWNRETKGW